MKMTYMLNNIITQNAILVPNLKEIFKELENLNIDKTAPCCQT